MVPAPEVKLSAKDIRKRFNDGKYAERASNKSDPSVKVGKIIDGGAAPTWAPKGARSQMIQYFGADGRTIAIAHQYGYPDGRSIRQTKPDPKFLFEEATRFKHDPRLD